MSGPTSVQIASGLRAALANNLNGLALSGMGGTIAAVGAHGANTVDVYLNNNASGAQPSAALSIPYLSDYNPATGDAVLILAGQAALKTSYIVLGTLAGASGGGGSSGLPIGAIVAFPASFTSTIWLPCTGGTFSAITYPTLNTLLGGNTLPNLQGVTLMGAGANGIVLGTLNTTGQSEGHTHTGPSHTHNGPSHTHTDSGHTHSHSHAPSSATGFLTNAVTGGGISTSAGGNYPGQITDSDSTSGSASLNNAGTGATSPGGTGATGSYGGSANVPPNYGIIYFIKAL